VVPGFFKAYHRTVFQLAPHDPLPERLTAAIEGSKGTIFRGIIRFIPEHLLVRACARMLLMTVELMRLRMRSAPT
jgi:hypothetical protein